MKVSITVKTNSKIEKVEAQPDGLKVYVNAPPLEGKANEAVCALLAEYFKVPKRSVRIISGQRSKKKLVEIS